MLDGFLLLVQLLMAVSEVYSCPRGWFGSRCDYMCHCADGSCSYDGQCKQGVKCETGWFGPSCQYEDISRNLTTVVLNSVETLRSGLIFDNMEETCEENIRTMILSSPEEFIFTWLRLTLRNRDQNITIQMVSNSRQSPMPCKDQRHFHVNDRTLDIYCTVDSPVIRIYVKFEVAQDVCSVYISGGRNVALKQETSQSSNWSEFGVTHVSSLAVDGNKSNFLIQKSCSHTNDTDTWPTWSVKFRNPVKVARYVLYNRHYEGFGASDRIQGFFLDGFNSDNALVYQHHDKLSTAQYVYSVVPTSSITAVSSVTIRATNTPNGQRIVELCEVEIFGETVCPDGKYGFECEKTRDRQVKDEINVSTSGYPHAPVVNETNVAVINVTSITNQWADLFSFIVISFLSLIIMVLFVIIMRRQKWPAGPQRSVNRDDCHVMTSPVTRQRNNAIISTSPVYQIPVLESGPKRSSEFYITLEDYHKKNYESQHVLAIGPPSSSEFYITVDDYHQKSYESQVMN